MSEDVIQGDSVDLEFWIADQRDLSTYTCRLQVRDSSDTLAGVNRTISTYNSSNTAFVDKLTAAETGAMSVGVHTVSAQLSEASSGIVKELNATINITKQYNY